MTPPADRLAEMQEPGCVDDLIERIVRGWGHGRTLPEERT